MAVPTAAQVFERLLYRFADEHTVVALQRRYVKFFVEARSKRVVDLGCGRGLFLGLLRDAGIDPVGVDGSAEVVEVCKKAGFNDTRCMDVLSFLREATSRGETFDGVFCSHVIEHLDSQSAVELIRGIANILAPGGRLVLATPNIAHPEVSSNIFWLDLTHVRPYPRMLLEAMVAEVGLSVVTAYDDPATQRPYFSHWSAAKRLPGDLLRYGARIFSGTDIIIVAGR